MILLPQHSEAYFSLNMRLIQSTIYRDSRLLIYCNFDLCIRSRTSVEVVLTSSRVVQRQIVDVSMLDVRDGDFDPVLK